MKNRPGSSEQSKIETLHGRNATLHRIVNIVLIVMIGLGLGGFSAWYSIQRNHAIGGISAGPWHAWPFAGGADADPYTVAKVARDGTIPLGATEGLAFEASTDGQGRTLRLECDYTLSGITPPSRLWTLAAYLADGSPVRSRPGTQSAMHSGKLLRFRDGSFRIQLSRYPRSGNWMPIRGNGTFYLVLRVYDTPVTSTTGLVQPQMPGIIRGDCSQ